MTPTQQLAPAPVDGGGRRPRRWTHRAGLGAEVLAAGTAAVTVLLALLVSPVLAALPLAVGAVVVALRFPSRVAVVLLIAAPLLLSQFQVGPLTVDNWLTLGGIACVAVAATSVRSLPFTRLSCLPLVFALAITVTGLVTGTPWVAAVVRFVGLAAVPWLVTAGAVSPRFTDNTLRALGFVGAVSVLLQPWYSLPTQYVDAQTQGVRYGGLLGHPNFAAYALGLIALYVLARRRRGAPDLVLVAVLAAGVLSTGSITGVVLFLVGALMCVLVRRNWLLAGALVAVPLVLAAGATVFARIDLLGSTAATDNSGTWRVEQWHLALDLLPGREAFGVGWQQAGVYLAQGLGVHNAYLQVLVELGLVGALLAVTGLVVLCASSPRTLAAAVCLAYVLTTSISDPVLHYPSSLVLLLAILARESLHPVRTTTSADRSHRAPGVAGA